jgi:hypothetical protein
MSPGTVKNLAVKVESLSPSGSQEVDELVGKESSLEEIGRAFANDLAAAGGSATDRLGLFVTLVAPSPVAPPPRSPPGTPDAPALVAPATPSPTAEAPLSATARLAARRARAASAAEPIAQDKRAASPPTASLGAAISTTARIDVSAGPGVLDAILDRQDVTDPYKFLRVKITATTSSEKLELLAVVKNNRHAADVVFRRGDLGNLRISVFSAPYQEYLSPSPSEPRTVKDCGILFASLLEKSGKLSPSEVISVAVTMTDQPK